MTSRSPDSASDPAGDFTAEVLTRLSGRARQASRYRIEQELAVGGMGAVLRVWDEDLRRHLAMKVALALPPTTAGGDEVTRPGSRALARFLEEAQITGQLDHPGIVPVHELGLDDQGRVFFTMRLVAGRDLQQIFKLVRESAEGWTETRAVGVLQKVCETMAYAHAKGVIHRDLKPANVMVGRFGEVYVMDWGLARVLGDKDRLDVRPQRHSDGTTSFILTDRGDARASGPEAGLVTMDGDVLGTPAYMSPEQARGALDLIGPASDVYSAGAILYELLAGHAPYLSPGKRADTVSVWTMVQAGAPTRLAVEAPGGQAELTAICEKAMQRDASQRYASMLDFANDLRAYLEGRVVRAYQSGAVAELRKWIVRNRALAATSAAAILLVSLGSAGTAYVLAGKNRALNQANTRTKQSAELAEARAAQVLRLSDITKLRELERSADDLWPAAPDHIDAYVSWLDRAGALAERRELHGKTLAQLRAAGTASTAAPGQGAAWSFATPEDQWQHDTLQDLAERLDRFVDPAGGLVANVKTRLEFARSVTERTVTGELARELWERARASIADPAECPAYSGLTIKPQLGLLPLGRDPWSGLWEFTYLQSGAPPVRDADTGQLAITEEMGIVLVLLPGGSFHMGAQSERPEGLGYDPLATQYEEPVHELSLAPYFLSKYEMTQGQWLAFTGANPSVHGPGVELDGVPVDLTHPVEQVSWSRCDEVLVHLGLALPTEAQWEYAARAGTTTPWSTGPDKESLEGAANLADQASARVEANYPARADWPELDDGFPIHSPVGYFRANAFGLHDMHGNVWEWCRDIAGSYVAPVSDGDGERLVADDNRRPNRGGSFGHGAFHARSSNRNLTAFDFAILHLGLRSARALER